MYLRVIWSGSIGTAEEFSVGASFTIDNDLENWNQEQGDAIAALIGAIAFPDQLRRAFPATVDFTDVRFEGRANDGSVLGASEAPITAAGTGTGTTVVHPPQTALVLSMRSTTPGQSGRGRLYWPGMSVVIGSTFTLAAGDRDDYVEAFASYLADVQQTIRDNAGLFPWTTVSLCVASTTKQTQAPVTRLQVGSVLDTQRRRRNGLVEQYSQIAFPPPAE